MGLYRGTVDRQWHGSSPGAQSLTRILTPLGFDSREPGSYDHGLPGYPVVATSILIKIYYTTTNILLSTWLRIHILNYPMGLHSTLAFVGYCGPLLAACWLLWACVGLHWLLLASVGVVGCCGPSLCFGVDDGWWKTHPRLVFVSEEGGVGCLESEKWMVS